MTKSVKGIVGHRARRRRNSVAIAGGTDGSNPLSSREESGANLTSSIRDIATVTEGAALRRVAVRMKFLTWTDNTCYASRLRRIARGQAGG
jgi:hypothetical protein